MTASARVMVPIDITPSMIKTGTSVPETDTAKGEAAWVSGASYTTGNLRNYGGSVWACSVAHSARTATPDADPGFWYREGPTNRMAPFDDYSNTKVASTGALTYVIQAGFLNGLSIYGIEAATYSIVVKDAPGGTVVSSWAGDLYSQAAGFYELLFSDLLLTTQLSFDGIPLAPAAEVTITFTSSPGKRVAIGTIKMGDWRQFIGNGSWGGTQYGAESERKSFSLREYNPDGSYKKMVRRASSRNVSCEIAIDPEQAMYADSILEAITDVAVPFEASRLPRHGYLNTLGFVTASMRPDSFGKTSIKLKVEGNI